MEGKVVGANIEDIVNRLLLFETYIIDSNRLQEIPHIVDAFGLGGFLELLGSRVLQIKCEPLMIGQIGQTLLPNTTKKGVLPLFSYSFRAVQIAQHEEFIHGCLQCFHEIGLQHKDVLRLKKTVVNSLVRVPPQLGSVITEQANLELRTSAGLLREAFNMELGRRFGSGTRDIPLTFRFEDIGDGNFRAETDLISKLNLSPEEAHKICEAAGLAVGSLSQRLAEMRAYMALTGFSDRDVNLARTKLDIMAEMIIPSQNERRFQRVLTLANFPDYRLEWGERKIDASMLLKLRGSDECRSFRDWLRGSDALTDKEIEERLRGVRARLAPLFGSTRSRVVRFLISTGLSSLGPVPGLIAGVIDTFLLEKVLPADGVVSFISNGYPSLFQIP